MTSASPINRAIDAEERLLTEWLGPTGRKIARLPTVPAPAGEESEESEEWVAPPAGSAFYGLAGHVVRLIEPHTEADSAALLLNFLTAFGSAVGSGPHAMVGATRHGVNLNMVLVGDSAKARKGDSWPPIELLLSRVDPEWMERVQGGVASGEGIIHAVRDAVTRPEPVKEHGQTVRYESQVVDAGEPDKRLLIMEPEFGRLLRVAGRQGSTLSAVLRQAWDGGNLRVMTRNAPGHATRAHISVIGHITREELVRELPGNEAVNGFGNRFLWAAVRRSKLLPEPVALDLAAATEIVEALSECVRWARHVGEVGRDGSGRGLWESVYEELSHPRPGLAGSLLARGEAQVLRLSVIYALLDRSPEVHARHITAALAVWQYVERSVLMLFGGARGDPIAEVIVRALNAAEELTRSDIRNVVGGHVPARRIDVALRTLRGSGAAWMEQRATAGRPIEVWHHG